MVAELLAERGPPVSMWRLAVLSLPALLRQRLMLQRLQRLPLALQGAPAGVGHRGSWITCTAVLHSVQLCDTAAAARSGAVSWASGSRQETSASRAHIMCSSCVGCRQGQPVNACSTLPGALAPSWGWPTWYHSTSSPCRLAMAQFAAILRASVLMTLSDLFQRRPSCAPAGQLCAAAANLYSAVGPLAAAVAAAVSAFPVHRQGLPWSTAVLPAVAARRRA